MNKDTHVPFLDAFRGIAILAVLFTHSFAGVSDNLYTAARAAHLGVWSLFFYVLTDLTGVCTNGVAIFFVISGFCIHLSYRRSQNSGWLVFFIRRFFRLYPAYLVSFFLFAAILPNTRYSADFAGSLGQGIDLALHLLMAFNLLPQTLFSINSSYWSLAIEFQLYLLFPLLLLVTGRVGWQQILWITAFVEFVSRIFLVIVSHCPLGIYPSGWPGWLQLSPFAYWFSWSLGAVLAEAFLEKKTLPFARGPLPLWSWPLIVLVAFRLPVLDLFSFPLAAFATARFLSYLLDRSRSTSPVEKTGMIGGTLNFFGTISYSLYLIHLPLMFYFLSLVPDSHHMTLLRYGLKFGWLLGILVAIVPLSYLLYRVVELPCIDLGKEVVRRLRRRQNSQATSTA